MRGDTDAALLLFTSGTTGSPKLVPLTERNLLTSAANVAETLRLEPTDRCLNVMPLFHIHGLVAALLGSLVAGGSVVCTEGFRARDVPEWIEEFRPTWYTAVPTIHQAMLQVARSSAAKGRALPATFRFVRSSSAALPVGVLEDLEAAFGVPVIEAYGMTEAAHQMTSNPLPDQVRKPGTVGMAAGPDVAVLDDRGQVLPAGRDGRGRHQGCISDVRVRRQPRCEPGVVRRRMVPHRRSRALRRRRLPHHHRAAQGADQPRW